MIRFYRIILLIAIFIFIISLSVSATAVQFIATPLAESEIANFVCDRDIHKIENAIESKNITCFDINQSGLVALGSNGSPYAVVNVYDFSGQFLYGFRILNRGAFMTLFFEGENVSVYFGRTHQIATFNSNAEVVLLREVKNNERNDSALEEITYRSPYGNVGEYTYSLEGGNIFKELSWSKFVLTDKNGNSTTIYDVSHNSLALYVTIAVASSIVFLGIQKNKRK